MPAGTSFAPPAAGGPAVTAGTTPGAGVPFPGALGTGAGVNSDVRFLPA
jgi:hypothetical protein